MNAYEEMKKEMVIAWAEEEFEKKWDLLIGQRLDKDKFLDVKLLFKAFFAAGLMEGVRKSMLECGMPDPEKQQ